MNKISIITVNRNNAVGLEKTILSVINQCYKHFEFIVIDGASTDESTSIIKKYSSHINYWISESDTGIFNAMNKGIVQASGDYCYFLNSADTFVSNDVLSNIFNEKVYTSSFINGNQINDFGTHKQKVPSLNRQLTLYDFYWGTIKHQATFIHRTLFDKYGLYDESLRIISDWKFFLQTIGLHNEDVFFLNDVDIVNFEWDGMSTNAQTHELHLQERHRVLDECIPKSIQRDYEHFREVSNFTYIAETMKKSKFSNFVIRLLVKLTK